MRAQEFIGEKINQEVITPGFKITKQMPNGFIITAEANKTYDNDPDPYMRDLRGVTIRVFDPKASSWYLRQYGIAEVRFIARPDVNTKEWVLRPTGVQVNPEYQRQGIASAMYNFARKMGNDVAPGVSQTAQGQAFWQKGSAGVGRDVEFTDPTPEPEVQEPSAAEPEKRPGLMDKLRGMFTGKQYASV